ncbi:MAG: M48 family metallopeptidase [Nitrospiraceae bacterium]
MPPSDTLTPSTTKPTAPWVGRLLDGHSAAAHPVTIDPAADALTITREDGSTLRWPYRDIRRTQGDYDGEQIRLEYGGASGAAPSSALVIDDQRFLSVLRKREPQLVAAMHDPARRGLRLQLTMIAAVAALLAVGVLYRWGIPGIAALVTPTVPVAWEQQLGERVVEQLAPESNRCADTHRSQVIHSLFARLSAAAPPNPYGPIRLYLVKGPTVNAFAAPGGHVVVFAGLLEKTESPEQLAGVLAHELQHIYKRHTTRMLLEQASTSFLLAAVAGDLTGVAAVALDTARTLGALRYSRGYEAEADSEGLKLMVAAGIDPKGIVDFFKVLGKDDGSDGGLFSYLSSHPSHHDRIATLTALAGTNIGQAPPLLPGLDWRAIRRACSPPTTLQPATPTLTDPAT